MLGLVILLISLVLVFLGHMLAFKEKKKDRNYRREFAGSVQLGFGYSLLAIIIGINFGVYLNCISKESDYRVIDNKIELTKGKQVNITTELKLEAQKYVNYEKEI